MLIGAGALLRRGDAQGALKGLLALVQHAPKSGEAFRLLGLTYQMLGDPQNAEAALRAAVLVAKRAPLNHSTLASLLAASGREKEAERAFRAALAIDPGFESAAVGLCNLLIDQGRPQDGAKLIKGLAEAPGAGPTVLASYGRALSVQGLNEEAAAVFRRAVDEQPQSAGAAHNLAAVLGDAARNAEAEAEARRAMTLGTDAPETWLILARALQAQARYDEAEAAYREVIARRPTHRDAHYGLAQLIWMRTGDKTRATDALTGAIGANPDALVLRLIKANALSFAGDEAAAQTQLDMALAFSPDEPAVMAATAQGFLRTGQVAKGLRLIESTLSLKLGDPALLAAAAKANLMAGDPERASQLAGAMLGARPYDQLALALQATAWRLMGDPRYQALYDYDAFVRSAPIEPPKGWKSPDAYLADLAQALHGMHKLSAHPFDQSVRGGGQISLLGSAEPAVAALPRALEAPIRAYVEALGKGDGPLRKRNTGAWAFKGLWSVKLASAGFHTNHIHNDGWLSSACHIELPDLPADDPDHAGWLKLGEPGFATLPPLGPEQFVRPEAGRLVLFPSYMWHGTVPFKSKTPRLSVAFDLVPA